MINTWTMRSFTVALAGLTLAVGGSRNQGQELKEEPAKAPPSGGLGRHATGPGRERQDGVRDCHGRPADPGRPDRREGIGRVPAVTSPGRRGPAPGASWKMLAVGWGPARSALS